MDSKKGAFPRKPGKFKTYTALRGGPGIGVPNFPGRLECRVASPYLAAMRNYRHPIPPEPTADRPTFLHIPSCIVPGVCSLVWRVQKDTHGAAALGTSRFQARHSRCREDGACSNVWAAENVLVSTRYPCSAGGRFSQLWPSIYSSSWKVSDGGRVSSQNSGLEDAAVRQLRLALRRVWVPSRWCQ